MLRLLALVFGGLLLFMGRAEAAQFKLKRLQVGSRVYTGVTVLGSNTTDVYFKHDEGIANVKLKYLSEELQRRFNYDAQAATEAERQQAEDDARYQIELAASLAAEAKARAEKAKAAPPSSPFADAISDKSMLGKPGPALELDSWIGERPATEGKYLLAYFWAPWSQACRKYVADINGLQKAFPEKLQVVGVLTEGSEEALKEAGALFPSGVDAKARLFTTAGFTSVPQVLLSDPKGLVIYQGHPGALNATNLAPILAKSPDPAAP